VPIHPRLEPSPAEQRILQRRLRVADLVGAFSAFCFAVALLVALLS
jgi:hypothetical protein